MYGAFVEKTLQSVEALRRHLATSDALRSAIHEKAIQCNGAIPCFDLSLLSSTTAPDRIEWKIIDHCTAVTRIYAIYEHFAQDMIREHLNLVQRHLSFSNLSADLQDTYRKGLATILEKKDGPRYGHINLPNLIEQYSLALTNKPYTLEPLAVLMQEQNLRLPELNRLFAACGISNMSPWIDKHRCVKEFFGKEGRLAASAEHEMVELIKYRNDAAHGSINIDELPGLDYLYEFCEFVSAVCIAMSERVQLAGLECLVDGKHAMHRGKVTECLKAGEVSIGMMTGNFSVGDTIYLCGDDYCMSRTITSMQINDVPHQTLSLQQPTELGIALDSTGRKNANIIGINPRNQDAATGAANGSPNGVQVSENTMVEQVDSKDMASPIS